MKKVSVIIPVHNEEDVIGKCLSAVLKQSGIYEIIVVNDGSTDRTREIVENYMKKSKKIRLINFSQGHSSAFAINRGAENAHGEYVIFVAADMILSNNFLDELKKMMPFKAGSYILKSYKPSTILQRGWSAYRKFAASTDVIFPFAFKRNFFLKIGEYREDIFYHEDAELRRRIENMNINIKKMENVIVYHIDTPNLKEFKRQRRWQGRKAPVRYFLPCLFPPILLLQLIRMLVITRDLNVFYWIIFDLIGRYISLFERIKFL